MCQLPFTRTIEKECVYRKYMIKDESGYTLLESLLHLSVLLLFAHLSVVVLHTTEEMSDIHVVEEIEWELFSAELLDMLTRSESLTIHPNNRGIHFMLSDGRYDITYYTGMIRKQKEGKGHEPLLLSVQQVHFSIKEHTLYLSVQFKSGKTKERFFVVPSR